MQVSPINQNMNNNTSFKRINIVGKEEMPAKLLMEIAKNKEIKAFAQYLHKYKVDLNIKFQSDIDRELGMKTCKIFMYAQNQKGDRQEVFRSWDYNYAKKSFLGFFDKFNAKESIDNLCLSLTGLTSDAIKKEAEQMIETFNQSLAKITV